MGEGGKAEVTIYDVAKAAGVAPSTVSRALAKPGRVSFRTAERIRQVAEELGYRTGRMDRPLSTRGTGVLALIVADIGNPVFVGMIRGAEQAATEHGLTLAIIETQESQEIEVRAVAQLQATVDGIVLASSRMPDHAVRQLAKSKPLVVLNRTVGEVASVVSDNVRATKKAVEHLVELGHRSIAYLAGPDASYANGMRWRGLREAGLELDLSVRRIGPFLPTLRGGAEAAERWRERPSTAVIAFNDLMALGFIRAVAATGVRVPAEVSVIGFDNIVDADLVQPGLTTIAAPLVSLGSTAVNYLAVRRARLGELSVDPVLLPARLVIRGSTGRVR